MSFVFYLVSLFSFQPFLMSTSALNERSRSNLLCDFRLGTVVTSDYETPLTGYEPNQEMNLTDAEEFDLTTTSDIYFQTLKTLSQGYEPKQFDYFNFPDTSATIFQDEAGDIDTEPSYSFDAELDELFRKALSSLLFTREREEPANLRQI